MPEVTLWLVRHGQSTANAGAPAADPMQIALTPLGHAQAQEAALQLDRAPDLLVVSPMLRAVQTANALHARWPHARRETWPIGEFVYLSPARCAGTTAQQRSRWVASYWEQGMPSHVDGEGAESFAAFMARVQAFHESAMQRGGFVVAVGHGQFFRAYTRALAAGFAATPEAMRDFRALETAQPLANGEIVKLTPGLSARTGG